MFVYDFDTYFSFTVSLTLSSFYLKCTFSCFLALCVVACMSVCVCFLSQCLYLCDCLNVFLFITVCLSVNVLWTICPCLFFRPFVMVLKNFLQRRLHYIFFCILSEFLVSSSFLPFSCWAKLFYFPLPVPKIGF